MPSLKGCPSLIGTRELHHKVRGSDGVVSYLTAVCDCAHNMATPALLAIWHSLRQQWQLCLVACTALIGSCRTSRSSAQRLGLLAALQWHVWNSVPIHISVQAEHPPGVRRACQQTATGLKLEALVTAWAMALLNPGLQCP